MKRYKFTWNKNKNTENQKKHGVSFDEARSVFYDDYARLIFDPDHSEDEDRFIIIGLSSLYRLLIICHCYRKKGKEIRIISARRANKNEQKQYERFHHER